MKVSYNEKKLKVNESMVAHAEKKLQKLDRYFRADAETAVKFSEERGLYIVEVTVSSQHMIFRAQEKSGDVVASFDGAVDAIERQILKNKTRLEKRLRDGAFERTVQTEKVPAAAPEDAADESDEFRVIRTKRFAMKPMSVDEAILQMNLLAHQFYAFKNIEDNRFCVVYTRENGGYGLIESD